MPCRIVGDPLQGIFEFGDNQIVNWEQDIFSFFDKLDELAEPWRWKSGNIKLGEWLLQEVRYKLIKNEPIDISTDLESIGCICDLKSEARTRSILLEILLTIE
jgi:DNA helicase-2/ATP-dependent DNA helicase PcrA